MAMNVDDFKKLVETLDLPEDVKGKVLEATKDENVVPYEWKDETHLGAEVEDVYGKKYILYSEDDSMDFFGISVDEDGRPSRNDARYINRRAKHKFTGRKAIMVDTAVPEDYKGAEVGELFTAKVDGEDVIVRRRGGVSYVWTAISPNGSVDIHMDKDVELLHRLVEAK